MPEIVVDTPHDGANRIVKLSDVHVLLADTRAHIRNALKVALAHSGLNHIHHASAVPHVTEAIGHSFGPDILICDMDMDDGAACHLVTALRHNDLGRNPFLCIIGMSWSPTPAAVNQAANSGVDHLIAAPVAPKEILDRISAMVFRRAPFVVTADYVGPDRRTASNRPSHIPLIDVPNSLREKAMGTWNFEEFERDIAKEVTRLNTRKIDRQAENIMALADLIAAQTGDGAPAVIRHLVERLNRMVDAMDQRASEHGFHHVVELCRASVEITRAIHQAEGPPDEGDVRLLKHMGQAIRVALYPTEHGREIAHQISEAVTASR